MPDRLPWARHLDIRQRLLLLVVATAAPLLLLSVVIVNLLARSELASQRAQLTYAALSAGNAVDTQLRQLVAIGRVLATGQALASGDFARFRAEAEAATKGLDRVWVFVATPDGQQVFNVLVPAGQPLPRSAGQAQVAQQRAFATGQPQVSDGFRSPLLDIPVVTVEIPVFLDGAPLYVVAMVVDVRHFLDILTREHLPKGWLAGIVDRQGHFIARSQDHDRLVLQPASEGLRAQMRTPGLSEFRSLDGDPLVNANAVSAMSGWAVAVAASKAALEVPIRRSLTIAATAGAALLLLSLFLAWWVARAITRPIKALETAPLLMRGRSTGIPEIDSAIAARASAEERLNLAVSSARLGIHTWNIADGKLDWDGRVRELWGIGPDVTPTYETFIAGLHPDDRARTQAAVDQAIDPAGDGRFFAEYRVRPHDGSQERWVRATGLVTFTARRPVRLIGTVVDITESKKAEERQALLVGELAHRGKNLLGVIQSIARQVLTKTNSPEENAAAFIDRLQSLARTYTTLIGNKFEGAEIGKMVRDELGPFIEHVNIAGPDIQLPGKSVQTFALALHELATNASKYGALSTPGGTVSVTWSATDGQDGLFSFKWQERGGPVVEPPKTRGFGSSITDRAIAVEFETEPHHLYAPEGVTYEFTAALAKITGARDRNPN